MEPNQSTLRPLITVTSLLMTAFVILLVLKLSGLIGWSWWLITLPAWILPVGYLMVVLFYVMLSLARFLFSLFTELPNDPSNHEPGH